MNDKTFSMVYILRQRAVENPDGLAYAFLENGVDVSARVTWSELDRQARAFAVKLLADGNQPGDRAIMLYPSGIEFLAAFMGCLYAGIVAVPSIIPHLKRATPRLKTIITDADASIACTTQDMLEKLMPLVEDDPDFTRLDWVVNEQVPLTLADQWQRPDILPESLCFLQYTSGSTSIPKGVMISHFNLLKTTEDLKLGVEFSADKTMVTWLPIFHDLGLIYGLLMPMLGGGKCYIMAPVTFLEQPYRWLAAVTKYRATHTGGPNFAYELCCHKITEEEKPSLDLSRVIAFANAAEPVRLETMQKFYEAFKMCGLHPHAQRAGYGLAEATVKVSGQRVRQEMVFASLDAAALEMNRVKLVAADAPNRYDFVSNGTSEIGADIRIVNPATLEQCSPDGIGEIWVQSESVAYGYWNRPDATRETFDAHLASGEGPFMRTGDMGFLLDGNLYITGRIKDMILVQGRNFYPQDIELTVEKSHPAMRPSCGAAFAVNDGQTDRLVIVQEIKREFRNAENFTGMMNAVRMAVAKNHGLRAHSVALIFPGTIAKTTSGKIQRAATRQSYLDGELNILAEWHAPGV
jgi:acyl-CoA synthetase (AMP-forming)/AMP-acid ligase II